MDECKRTDIDAMQTTPHLRRKPIYDSDVPHRNTAPLPSHPVEPNPVSARESSLTSQLATYVRQARIFTHAHVALAENKFNEGAKAFFDIENNITSTIADLAPDPRTGEKVLPGAIYVVVAGMAGSIITRNRNILLRASVPVALAVGASNYLLPHTSANIGALVWRWEQRFPVVADGHLRARRAVTKSVEDAQRATFDARRQLDDGVRRTRQTLEDWVKKGQ